MDFNDNRFLKTGNEDLITILNEKYSTSKILDLKLKNLWKLSEKIQMKQWYQELT